MASDLIDETLLAHDPNVPKPRGLLPVSPEVEASIASGEAKIAKEHGIQIEPRKERNMQTDIQYEIILHWSKQDQAFIAEVPELPGCVADGATYQEALANVEVVIREWIDTARELGRAIPEPRGRLMFA